MPQSLTRTAPTTRVFPCLTLFLKQLSDIPTVLVPVNSAFMFKVDVTNAYDRHVSSELAWEPGGLFLHGCTYLHHLGERISYITYQL